MATLCAVCFPGRRAIDTVQEKCATQPTGQELCSDVFENLSILDTHLGFDANLLAPRFREDSIRGVPARVFFQTSHGSVNRSPHGREVALKVLKPELGGAPATQLFLREIEIAAKLSHPHILPLFDSGEADGLFHLVMPYVDGDSLRDRFEREGTLPLDQAVTVVSEVADALATLQQQDVGGYLATRPRSGTEWVVTREKGGMWNIDGVPSPREKNTR